MYKAKTQLAFYLDANNKVVPREYGTYTPFQPEDEIPESVYNACLGGNPDSVYCDKIEVKKEVEKPKENFDFNKDGKVDKKDVKLAAKLMGKTRQKKR